MKKGIDEQENKLNWVVNEFKNKSCKLVGVVAEGISQIKTVDGSSDDDKEASDVLQRYADEVLDLYDDLGYRIRSILDSFGCDVS